MALPFAANSQMIGPAMGAAPQAASPVSNLNLPNMSGPLGGVNQQQSSGISPFANIDPNMFKVSGGGYNAQGQVVDGAGNTLPSNYQDARNAFDQQRAGQISGPSLTVTGNDQFGQQFGYAADADAFDQFYNQNYANSLTPLPQQPGGTGGLPPSTPNQPTINNPLSMTIPGSVPNFAAVPDLGMTAGSAPGAGGLTQGTALPNITTVQKQATATPTFYTDYLNQLAKQGASAAQNAQFVGPTGLQSKAFDLTARNVGSYDPALDAATNLAGQAGSYDAAAAAGRYMNPYTQNVVDALGVEGRRNIEKYLAPGATAAAVGSGQFGSKRGAEVLGQAINSGLSNLNLAQSQALQTGYSQALQASQQEQQARLAGSQRFSDIANQRQALGLGDINATATIGEQQRALAQNQQLFPMQQLTSQAALLRGQTIPTSTSSSYTGPIPGAYNASPLSQIAGLGALAKEIPNLFSSISSGVDKIASGAVGNAVNRGFNALTGGSGGTKPIAEQRTLADGSLMNIATDGTKSIMFADGRVENYDRAGNLLPSGSSGDMGYTPGYNEQDLYDQEAAYNDYANYYDNYYDYYNNDNYFPNYEPPPPDYYYPNYEE
jgi:hypothetical protein